MNNNRSDIEAIDATRFNRVAIFIGSRDVDNVPICWTRTGGDSSNDVIASRPLDVNPPKGSNVYSFGRFTNKHTWAWCYSRSNQYCNTWPEKLWHKICIINIDRVRFAYSYDRLHSNIMLSILLVRQAKVNGFFFIMGSCVQGRLLNGKTRNYLRNHLRRKISNYILISRSIVTRIASHHDKKHNIKIFHFIAR